MTPEPKPDLPNYSPDPSLTPLQHRVLALLAEGRSLTDAAAEAGVHRNTVCNWRRSVPAFTRDTEFAIREQAVVWHDRMVQLAPLAAQVLHKVLNDEAAPASLRLRAAVTVLKAAANPFVSIIASEVERVNPAPVVHKEIPKSRTIVHNAPVRLPPQPSRNSLCPCGSGQKFKRCCAHRAPPQSASAAGVSSS